MVDEPFDEYLWDRSGEPDAYVRHLENLLERYRFEGPIERPAEPAMPRWTMLTPTLTPPRTIQRWISYGLAATAAAVVLFAAYLASIPAFGQPGRDWRVVTGAGRPIVSGAPIAGSGTLAAGGVVETDANARAVIRAGRVGRIDVLPGSRVRLLSTGAGRHRLAVDRGRIAAKLWSPPFTFGFATPAGDAFDVGCAFTMEVGDDGATTVRVTSGWVQFEAADRQQLVPEGATAIGRPGRGIGTPYLDGATARFKQALEALDFDTLSLTDRQAQLGTMIADARPEDVYTLLALIRRLTPPERGQVYDRAAILRPAPANVTRAGVMASDGEMLDAWRHSLGLPEVKRWWIHWTDALDF